MLWFMYFWLYSFLGFLLETGYSFVTTGGFVTKKCFIFSLLCPVYGIGALSIIGTTYKFRKNYFYVFIIGALVATMVEYFVDFAYEMLFGMHIWNYSGLPYNLNGRVCLLFTFFWGILSVVLVRYIHPVIEKYTPCISNRMCILICIFFIFDSICSSIVLKEYSCKEALSLQWLVQNT